MICLFFPLKLQYPFKAPLMDGMNTTIFSLLNNKKAAWKIARIHQYVRIHPMIRFQSRSSYYNLPDNSQI